MLTCFVSARADATPAFACSTRACAAATATWKCRCCAALGRVFLDPLSTSWLSHLHLLSPRRIAVAKSHPCRAGLVPRQIRFREFRVRFALIDVRLRVRKSAVCDCRTSTAPLPTMLALPKVAHRARRSARHVLSRSRHVHSRRLRVRFCERQLSFRLVQRRLIIPRIDLHQYCPLSPLGYPAPILPPRGRRLRGYRVTCPSTCASSVLSRSRYTETVRRLLRALLRGPISAKGEPRIREPLLRLFDRNVSQRRRFRLRSVGFSTCSSMSTLIAPSLGVPLPFGRSIAPVRSRLIEPVQRRDLVVMARARESCAWSLRCCLPRPLESGRVPDPLLLSMLHTRIRHLHFVPRRSEVDQRRLHFQCNLVSQICCCCSIVDFKIRPVDLCVNPPAGENRHRHRTRVRGSPESLLSATCLAACNCR